MHANNCLHLSWKQSLIICEDYSNNRDDLLFSEYYLLLFFFLIYFIVLSNLAWML